MKITPHNSSGSAQDSFEATLHVIAHVRVPEGIEERVHAALAAAPRHPRVLAWPGPGGAWTAAWLRAAAAAAIVVVVAGGGWGIYTRVQHQSGKMVVVPAPVIPAGVGFSNAGAIRTPQTVQGPVLAAPVNKPSAKPAAARQRAAHRAGQAVAGKAVRAVAGKVVPAAGR